MAPVLMIDDDRAFRESFGEAVRDLGFEITLVGTVGEALALLDTREWLMIFLDFKLPGMNGIDGIRAIKEKLGASAPPIVMLTGFLDNSSTIAAMKLGAYDHLNKPVGRAEIEKLLRDGEKLWTSRERKASGTKNSPVDRTSEDVLIGQSPALRTVLKMIGKVAATDTSCLIIGETGTGKELVARAIHQNSDRSSSPFVAINCAAIPENLLESELFGHVKGSFTGAVSDKRGAFQNADRGTLFLDEIGDMPVDLQSKLLRVLQEREITPVGSSKPIKLNIRVIAATHQNLREHIESRQFREDLYYRLNVVEIDLPPLRERREDVERLARHFLDRIVSAGEAPKTLTPSAIEKLEAHDWPGNVRELRNVIERAKVLSSGHALEAEDIQLNSKRVTTSEDFKRVDLNLPNAIHELERQLISQALQESGQNRSEAARKLGIQRQLLYTKMKEYGF